MLVVKGELCVRKNKLLKVASSLESVLVYYTYCFLTQPFNLSDSDNQDLFYSIWPQFPRYFGSKCPHFVELFCKQSQISASFIVCSLIPNDHFLSIHCVQSSKKTTRSLCRPCPCVFSWTLSGELHPTHIQSSTLGSLVVASPSGLFTGCTCLLQLQLLMCKCALTPTLPRCGRLSAWSANLHPGSLNLLLSTTEGETYTISLIHRGVVRTKGITLNNPHLFGTLFLKLFWNSFFLNFILFSHHTVHH